ncbi:hypothetical protein LJC14_05260 [Treponema sp. OttesenSCG-928-L16]|nr:hypothetical protein [Treponema sp. OttesenSCG-928-L16]
MAAAVKYIRDRMKELYVYDLYGLRGEVKILGRIVDPWETINCFATGVMDGLRRMLAITVSRVIIIGSHPGSSPDLLIIPRKDIVSHSSTKRFFTSSIEFSASNGAHYELVNVSGRVLELFNWALDRPFPDEED